MFLISNILPIFQEDIMPGVRADVGTDVQLEAGHYAETLKQMDTKSADPAKPRKYPLVWLVLDMEEKIAPRLGILSQPLVEIVIASDTLPTYSTQEREELIFVPTLYPIYESLINRIMNSRYLDNHLLENIRHSKFNRYFWGGSDNLGNSVVNLFNDFVDAIQIKGLNLSIKKSFCSQPNLK